MKTLKILSLTFLLLGCFTLKGTAQRVIASDNLDAFIGTWEYRGSTEYFKITLQAGEFTMPEISYYCLVGGYYYEKNGVVMADYLSPIILEVNSDNLMQVKITASSLAHFWQPKNATSTTLSFTDDGKGQKGSGMGSKLVLLDANRIQWILKEGEQLLLTDDYGNYHEGFEPKPLGFSVPTDVVLTKVQ